MRVLPACEIPSAVFSHLISAWRGLLHIYTYLCVCVRDGICDWLIAVVIKWQHPLRKTMKWHCSPQNIDPYPTNCSGRGLTTAAHAQPARAVAFGQGQYACYRKSSAFVSTPQLRSNILRTQLQRNLFFSQFHALGFICYFISVKYWCTHKFFCLFDFVLIMD